MRIDSKSFDHGGILDRKYTLYGDNVQPHLDWSDFPKETISFIVMVDDADAPGGVWNHWMIFNIPYNITEFKENQHVGAVAPNSWGEQRYMGPHPANNLNHQYEFKLYAVNRTLDDVSAASTPMDIMKAASPYIIDSAVRVVQYFKPDSSFGGTTESPSSMMGPLGTGELPA